MMLGMRKVSEAQQHWEGVLSAVFSTQHRQDGRSRASQGTFLTPYFQMLAGNKRQLDCSPQA